jgi:small redox-active disulfide protein 2
MLGTREVPERLTAFAYLAILPIKQFTPIREEPMKIQILGTGCPKCNTLERNAREAVTIAGVDAEVEKVTDLDEIMEMGVMVTPALAVDGDVKQAGKVMTVEEIAAVLAEG